MSATWIRALVGIAFFTTLSLIASVVPPAGVPVAEASNACFSSHSFGSGTNLMTICFSSHGNLVKFESPAGFEQIGQLNLFRDGYAICTGQLPTFPNVSQGYDAGGVEAGFGPPTILQPNGPNTFPLTITRDTTSGIYRLEQKLSRDTTEKDVTIAMTVTRLTSADCGANGCPPVRLSRYFEGDVDNNTSAGARFARTADSVWEWVEAVDADGRSIRHGLMLSNLTNPTDHVTTVHSVANHNPTGGGLQTGKGCIVFSGQVTTPTDPAVTNAADLVGRILYGVSLPTDGAKKTIKVLYRRF